MTVVDTLWITGLDTIGIVKCTDEITGETKFYMGVGNEIDENDDIKYITEYGTKINSEYLRNFLE